MTTQDCIHRITEIIRILSENRRPGAIKLWVEADDIEALEMARGALMHGEDDLK